MSKSVGSSVGSQNVTGPKSQLEDYYLWEEPERGIRIYLNLETVDCLQVEVLRGVDGFSSDEAEVGGILIGRTQLAGERTITIIEDFARVPCSYSSGPLYRLSQKDVNNFEAALARCSSDTRGLSVVGYYRSHKRDDLYLSSDDVNLIQKYFPEPDKVFLLVKSLPSRACTAGFFFWEDDNIQTEFTYLEVPFGPVQSFPVGDLTRPPAARVDDRLTPAEKDFPNKLPAVQSLPLSESVRQNRRVWLVRSLAAAVAALVVTLAGLNYWESRRSPLQKISAVASTSLGLGVQRKADSLTLTWNPNSRDLLGADEAILYINEGSNQKALHLDPSQLRSGAVSFVPSSDDVELRLEIDRGARPTAVDKVHLLLPNIPVGVSEREAIAKSTKTQGALDFKRTVVALVDTHQRGASSQAASKSALTASTNEKEQAQPTAPLSSSESSLKPFRFVAPTPPIQSLTSSVPPLNDIQLDPPSIPIETKFNESIVRLPVVRPEPPPPPNNPTQPAVERRPVVQGEAPVMPVTPAASGKAGSSQPSPVSSFVGPQLIRQVNPSIPSELRPRITSDLQIEVEVTIDVNGKVTDARIASAKGATARFISGEVLRAARLFLFRPAQDNHRNVESKMVLTFRFSDGATK